MSKQASRAFTPLLLILEDIEDAWWFRSLTADQTLMLFIYIHEYIVTIHANFYFYHHPMPGFGGSNRQDKESLF